MELAGRSLAFGDFELDLDGGKLRQRGVPIAIRPKLSQLLQYFVDHRDRVVTKEELRKNVWPGVSVSDEALTSALRDLRRALGDCEAPHRTIVTVRARGYRFAAPLRSSTDLAGDGGSSGSNGELLMDREDVMQRLEESLTTAGKGQVRVSLLAGPAGIGKTRAGMELVRRARYSDFEVHVARCYSGDGATAFWPWLQIVRSCLNSGDALTAARGLGDVMGRLGWVFPELRSGESSETRADLDGLEARFRFFDAMGMLLKELSKKNPLLLFIDDLHWADEASLLLLEFLSETVIDARLCVLAGFRDTEVAAHPTLARVLGTLASHPWTERIELGGLRRESVARLLHDAAGREAAPGFVDTAWNVTGGNPFFVAELVDLVVSGRLDVTDPAAVPLPGRVRDTMRLQIERLSSACRDVLKLASLVGREVELVILSKAAGLSEMQTLELVDEAMAAGLFVRVLSAPGRYAFSHDLVREALYAGLGPSERTRLHRRMGAALESFGAGDRLPELAHHYGEAAPDGVAEKALLYAERAAERAVAIMAYEDAVAYYERALTVLPMTPGAAPEARCRLLLDQAEAAWGTLEPATAVQARFERAAESARALGSAELLARAALGRSGYRSGTEDYRDIGHVDPVDIRLLREAAELLGAAPSASKARVLARLALAVRDAEDVSVSEKLSEEAMAMAHGLGDPVTLAVALRYRHEVRSSPEFARERLGLAERILDLARGAGHRPLEIDALFFLARDRFELGDLAAARDAGDAAIALASAMRHPGAVFRTETTRVLRLTLAGRWEEALSRALRQHERDARNLAAPGTYAAQRIIIHWIKGEYEPLIPLLESEAERVPVFRSTRYGLGLIYARVGRRDEARLELERAARDAFRHVPRDHTLLASFIVLADLCYELDDRKRARELYELAAPFDDMIAAPYIATVCNGANARALGVMADLFGDYDRAERHFERALAIEKHLSPALAALTLARYARMLQNRSRGRDRDRASNLLGKAEEIAAELGMRNLCGSFRTSSSGLQAGNAPRAPRSHGN